MVLVGDAETFEETWHDDEGFAELFKVKVEFEDTFPFDRRHVRAYAAFVSRLCRSEGLPHLDRGALLRLLDEARRLAGRSRELTARMSTIADIVRESGLVARRRRARRIRADDVRAALAARTRRRDLAEERLHLDLKTGILHLDLKGRRVGVVNSLVVYEVGGHVFGQPSRVTAAASPGTAGIINIEREVDLSGSSHDKGVLILTGYLRRRFAGRRPLSLSASLCLEQSYAGVEGDSASLAECLALISALAEVPVR